MAAEYKCRKSGEKKHLDIQIRLNRPAYSEEVFTEQFSSDAGRQKPAVRRPFREVVKTNVCRFVRDRLRRCSCKAWVLELFPVLEWLPKYELKKDLLPDFTAGLTVGVLHIPQGLGFAMMASLPAVTGLYTALIPVLIYMLMGTSRYLSQGSFPIICLMVAHVCEREVLNMGIVDSYQNAAFINATSNRSGPTSVGQDGTLWSPLDAKKLEIAVSLALLIGLIQVAMGVVKLGFVATYLSDPMVSGFTTGCAVLVVLSQLKHILGLEIPQITGLLSSVKTAFLLFKNITRCNVGSIITGVLGLIVLIACKTLNEKYKGKLLFPIPAELIVVTAGTAMSYGGDINSNFDVKILGTVPNGLPPISIPSFALMGNIITDAFVIAIVIFATNISLAKMYAKKNGQTIDPNQELIAYGACNIGMSFFSGFAICNALSRTAVQENIGRTQLCSLVVVALVLLVLLFIAHLFFHLPKAILAAVVITNLIGLLRQFSKLKLIWKISRTDAIVWVVTCFSVILLGVDIGLGCGIFCAVLVVVLQSSRPKHSILGRISDTDIYRDIKECPMATELQGIKILRFESSLYYVNVEYFKSLVQTITNVQNDVSLGKQSESKPSEWTQSKDELDQILDDKQALPSTDSNNNTLRCPAIHTLIVDASTFTFIDYVGIMAVKSIVQEYQKFGIQILLANCSHHIKNKLIQNDILKDLETSSMFVSINDAVIYSISVRLQELKETSC